MGEHISHTHTHTSYIINPIHMEHLISTFCASKFLEQERLDDNCTIKIEQEILRKRNSDNELLNNK